MFNHIWEAKRSSYLSLIAIIALLFTSSSPILPVSNVLGDGQMSVEKPLDPLYINCEDTKPGIINVDMDIGEQWNFYYRLEAGKRYHIYIVGDWVDFLDPQTDYDIFTYAPDGVETWHTESAGLPEHVANDKPHQFFETAVSGVYNFEIVNDKRDSNGTDAAVFMLIEHIETDVWYSRHFVGRINDKPVFETLWSYEFATDADSIHVIVNVSDTLDMYEARLYPMANPAGDVGYNIWGVPVPSGELLQGETTRDNMTGAVYGGYNTTIEGYRASELMASCEYKGEDMEIWFEKPEGPRSLVSYYLVLIAERGEGDADFYVQTDFSTPNITLVEPPERGYAAEETRIEASISSVSEVRSVWAEYIDDGGETWEKKALSPDGDLYVCDLPPFPAGVYVNYTVYARDEFGSVGSVEAGFPVKNKVTLDCEVARSELKMGQEVEVRGTATPGLGSVALRFTNGDHEERVEVAPDASGVFTYLFKPSLLGEWNLQALFSGSELGFPASSGLITFITESAPTSIVGSLSSSEVKQNDQITVSGTVAPQIQGLTVEVAFASPTSYHVETVVTDADGGFSCSFNPPEAGAWSVFAQVRDESLRYAQSQSGLMEFFVAPLGPLDRVTGALGMMITPPYLFLTIGLTGVGAALAVFKGRARLIPLLPSSIARRMTRGNRKRRTEQRYRKNRR